MEGQGGIFYSYDGLNRLTSIERKATTTGANQSKTEFVYDGLSRKRISREYGWNSTNGVWVLSEEKRRVYDGMDVIQERDAQNKVTVNYTRSGNIGGLLARTVKGDATATPPTPDRHYFYHYDGSGNVMQLSDAAQQVVAAYEYDAYGNLVDKSGMQAEANRYRFSTKEMHQHLGYEALYDYGYRFYSPSLGRWINRDPIEEDGGLNLYGMVDNNPVNYVDSEGLGKVGIAITVGKWGVKYGKALSRDVAKRLYKKEGKHIYGSNQQLRKWSKQKGRKRTKGKEDGKDEPPCPPGPKRQRVKEKHSDEDGEGTEHMHPGGRTRKGSTGKKGGHGFLPGAKVIVPGATLGKDVFGDNLAGGIADFINPMSDVQDVVDIFQ